MNRILLGAIPVVAAACFFAGLKTGKKGRLESVKRIEINRPENERTRGALRQDKAFIKVCSGSRFHEIPGSRKIYLLDLVPNQLLRTEVLRVGADARSLVCATRGMRRWFLVEEGGFGERLRMRGERGTDTTVFKTVPPEPNGEARHIHSLSSSPSGRLLAFMVSRNNKFCDWRGQTLMIYDVKTQKLKAIWKGDIAGPEGMLTPYKWVQPLPWSTDEKELLVSTPPGDILAINTSKGSSRTLCSGYLPIGFVEADALLVLNRSRSLLGSRSEWLVARHNLKTKRTVGLLRIGGPTQMRAPLLSPDRAHMSFVALIFPDGKPVKGIYLYTLIVRLTDLRYALIDAEITAWSAR